MPAAVASQPARQVSKAVLLPLLCLCGGEQPLLLESHNNRALQHKLWLWTMPETGVHLFFSTAHPQKGVPQVSLQEGCRGFRWQTQEWRRQQQPRGFFQSHPKKDGKGTSTHSQGSSAPLASQTSPCHSRWGPRRMTGKDGKRQPT